MMILPDTRLFLHFASDVDVMRHEFLEKIKEHVQSAVKDYPNGVCEGSVTLGGVEHFYTCRTYPGSGSFRWFAEMYLMPREDAEKLLNEGGLSTHEPFNPLPEALRPH